MDTVSHFDLVVIGSGPAGEKAATEAHRWGKSSCVIDAGPTGGAWVNTGTIPSKTLRESALFLAGGRRRGVMLDPTSQPTIRAFMGLKRHLVARWREKLESRFRATHCTRVRGQAHFVDSHTVEIDDGRRFRGERIMIATGSRPRRLNNLPVDGKIVQNSNSILHIDHIPHSMIFLGGGVIAVEYAAIFQALGVQVTLINGRDRLLGFIDSDVVHYLEQALIAGGMAIRHQARPEELGTRYAGEVDLNLSDGTVVSAEQIFVALGRLPNVESLNLEAVDVKLADWGAIEVNDSMQTSNPVIYAGGDVVGFPSLASASMEQGRVAANHMFGHGREPLDELIPAGIYTIPEVSAVGLDEQSAKRQGRDVMISALAYDENVRAPMLGDEFGMVKLIADRQSRKLLGAAVVGERATELIHIPQAVIKYGGTVEDLQHMVFNVPTLSALFRQTANQFKSPATPPRRAQAVDQRDA